MKREELEHVLRAASRIVEQRDFLVIGSAAILGTYSEDVLPHAASRSEEADLAPFDDPTGEKSAAVEGSLGQLSAFHETYGYYADGVDFKTAAAPEGWEQRLVAFAPPGAEPGRGLPWSLARPGTEAGRSRGQKRERCPSGVARGIRIRGTREDRTASVRTRRPARRPTPAGSRRALPFRVHAAPSPPAPL
jgi:hypothetical protein